MILTKILISAVFAAVAMSGVAAAQQLPAVRDMMLTKILISAVFATVAMSGVAAAQQLPAATQQTGNIKRTPLQKFDVPGTSYETVVGIAEIVPNVNVGRHTHPGPDTFRCSVCNVCSTRWAKFTNGSEFDGASARFRRLREVTRALAAVDTRKPSSLQFPTHNCHPVGERPGEAGV